MWSHTCEICGRQFRFASERSFLHACTDGETVTYVPPDWKSRPKEERQQIHKPRRNPPSITRQAYNYSKAAIAHKAAGKPEATPEQVAERFVICQSNRCGFFIDKGDGLGQCAHSSCGCSLKRLAASGERSKLKWADQECPAIDPKTGERFWGKITPATPSPPARKFWTTLAKLLGR